MSSRQLQKMRKQQELLKLQQAAAAGSDDESDEPAPQPKARGNAFSGFAALGDMGGDDDDEDDSDKDDDKSEQRAPSPTVEAPAKKSKKSKKKKKKGKKPDVQEPQDSTDDIDKVLKELQLAESKKTASSPANPLGPGPSSHDTIGDLFQINFQHLKVGNEMRRIFGKVMHTSNMEESAAQNARPRAIPQEVDLETYLSANQGLPSRAGNAKPLMFDTVLKNNPFIEGKKTWPRGVAAGLSMGIVEDLDGTRTEYAFTHDKTYEALETHFFQLVQMFDPMRIVHFLHSHPYHISSLIQVSKVAKQDQNSVLAADLIERALFTFGRVSLKEFRSKLEKGRVYIDFARPENRQFYLAGWHLIQHLALKGTYRTALEWTKLLLGINHDDPYAVANWAHVLAIRAHESQWFIDLCKTKLLDETKGGLPTSLYIKQTLALAHLQQGQDLAARALIVDGIQRLPWLYCALFSALGLETPRSIWGIQPRNDHEDLHTRLYIHMAKDLWTGPQIASLLKTAADLAQKPDPNTLPPSPPVSLGTARFIYLDGNTDLMSAVPRPMLHASPNFDFDPLPPAKEDNLFSSAQQMAPWDPAGPPPGLRMTDIMNVLQRANGEQLRALAVEAGVDVAAPGDERGLLARIMDLLVRRGAVTLDGGDGAHAHEEHDGGGLQWPRDGHVLEQHVPGAWLTGFDDDEEEDEIDYWGLDDFDEEEEEDDDFGDEDDDELPGLEEAPPLRRPAPRAMVEDAEDSGDDIPDVRARAMQPTVEDAVDSDELPELEDIPAGPGARRA
ncbi:transcriptional repressor TCF25-domain-containing protein [Podospora conica]|nr:transcriptional repressor TCF25-domain-containing protein [Schizothecium conicum]